MNFVILGATSLVGRGVLHACLRDETVTRVTAICRREPEITHPKLTVLRHDDFADLRPLGPCRRVLLLHRGAIGGPGRGRVPQGDA
jgi:hypothetical protein